MKKRTRTILQELNNLNLSRKPEDLISSTGNNLIESSINLLSKIYENFGPEEALDLERRFLNSIRTGDPKKFKRGIEKTRSDNNDTE